MPQITVSRTQFHLFDWASLCRDEGREPVEVASVVWEELTKLLLEHYVTDDLPPLTEDQVVRFAELETMEKKLWQEFCFLDSRHQIVLHYTYCLERWYAKFLDQNREDNELCVRLFSSIIVIVTLSWPVPSGIVSQTSEPFCVGRELFDSIKPGEILEVPTPTSGYALIYSKHEGHPALAADKEDNELKADISSFLEKKGLKFGKITLARGEIVDQLSGTRWKFYGCSGEGKQPAHLAINEFFASQPKPLGNIVYVRYDKLYGHFVNLASSALVQVLLDCIGKDVLTLCMNVVEGESTDCIFEHRSDCCLLDYTDLHNQAVVELEEFARRKEQELRALLRKCSKTTEESVPFAKGTNDLSVAVLSSNLDDKWKRKFEQLKEKHMNIIREKVDELALNFFTSAYQSFSRICGEDHVAFAMIRKCLELSGGARGIVLQTFFETHSLVISSCDADKQSKDFCAGCKIKTRFIDLIIVLACESKIPLDKLPFLSQKVLSAERSWIKMRPVFRTSERLSFRASYKVLKKYWLFYESF